MEKLLDESFILNRILNLMSINELDKLCLVCQKFAEILESDDYWYQRFMHYYPNELEKKPDNIGWKDYYHIVDSGKMTYQTIIQCLNHISDKLNISMKNYNNELHLLSEDYQRSLEELNKNQEEQEKRLNKIQEDIQKWKKEQKKQKKITKQWEKYQNIYINQ